MKKIENIGWPQLAWMARAADALRDAQRAHAADPENEPLRHAVTIAAAAYDQARAA
jgi:hypothetical protein